MIKKILAICSNIVCLFVLTTIPAFAHVTVSPETVGIAATQAFTIDVPNEKDTSVTSVRLLIPDGVSSVVPNTAPGWTITTKPNGNGDNATVAEIDWTDGSIPVGQRQEFVFQAQVPAKQTTLAWKAYQMYSDGTVVSWDVDPAKMKNLSDAQQDALADKENKGEYSTTQVINDLNDKIIAKDNASQAITRLTKQVQWLMVLSGGALAVSILSLGMQLIKRE